MKRTECVNCKVPGVKCFLCRDCIRMAIIAPLITIGIEQAFMAIRHWLRL